MPTAKSKHPTTTRRRTLFGTAAAVTATTIAAPAVASVNPDAELIACCERLIAIEGEMNAIFDALAAANINSDDNPDIAALYEEIQDLMQRIKKLPNPSTPTGLRRMSQVALSLAEKEDDGSPVFDGNAEWLAWRIARVLSGGGVA